MVTVLVGGTDEECVEIYCHWFSAEGWSVQMATDGSEVWSADRPLDAAVVHSRAHAANGDEIAQKITSAYPSCAVVMVTPFGTLAGAERRRCDRHLTKPIQRTDLVGAVEGEVDC